MDAKTIFVIVYGGGAFLWCVMYGIYAAFYPKEVDALSLMTTTVLWPIFMPVMIGNAIGNSFKKKAGE